MSAFFTEEKREKIESYLRLLVSSKHNLTAIKNLDEAYQKHFLDVFLPLKEFSLKGNFIDIGTGGGVPGIICAILFPESKWTLLDSIRKKVQEIDNFIYELGLKNVRVICQRAEEYAKLDREKYCGAFMRAVARSDVCLEYAAPLIKTGGKIYLYRGPNWKKEKDFAERAASLLGLRIDRVIEYQITENIKRNLVIYKKLIATSLKYPRKTGSATKKPLGGK
ncbi:MAG: 16S rRNA (guanine(527)-N(7))-methyltransferase RsmG [Kosmotoga sp.]|uniref:16S rRNA (guanine(527)-N(7))-methyltransferase RsmG n=1 Tax=Kosmotoga sp. TaxID=1955248 RepID=UPI001E103FEE|nr:16S rRNA (guanine(527)-N(7))-methyltransferase RsmG [Kosmotoga sp.]MBO8165976.1 16S rRNA (guanine(527)-N(7))-methyltransferase RsmG [Kosmotoga sp.]